MRVAGERLTSVALFCILFISYIYVFPRWADPNQNSRLDMIVAVVEDGTFQIDPYVSNTVDYARVGDHYYSDKAPGAAFLGIPIYAGLRLVLDTPLVNGLMERLANNATFQATLRADGSGLYLQKVRFAIAQVVLAILLSALPTALVGVLLFRWLGRFTHHLWPRLGAVLVYGLLTPAYAYAGAFYGHQLSAALLIAAFYLLSSARRERQNEPVYLSPARLLVVGVLLAYGVVTEYPAALPAGVLFLYACYLLYRQQRIQQIGWLVMTGGLVAAGWMAYNWQVFGGPLNLGYSYSELWQNQHHTGFMSLTWPHWEAVWGITLGGFRGLFVLSPVMLLAFPGYVAWWREGRARAEWWVTLIITLAIFLFNASSIMWWGGFAVGPRYLLPALPFIALGVFFALKRWGARRGFRLLFGVLSLCSLVATWGLTLAEQAFPPDTIPNPLLSYALPNWLVGNIARNVGTVLGLPGVWSLLPLIGILAAIALAWYFIMRRSAPSPDIQRREYPVEAAVPAGQIE